MTPAVGDGYFWWTLDVLKFDAAFYGHLRQTAAVLALVGMWAFSKQLTEYSVKWTLFWLAVAGTVLSAPNLGLYYGLADWTQANFGFGARTIAVIDAAASCSQPPSGRLPSASMASSAAPAPSATASATLRVWP